MFLKSKEPYLRGSTVSNLRYTCIFLNKEPYSWFGVRTSCLGTWTLGVSVAALCCSKNFLGLVHPKGPSANPESPSTQYLRTLVPTNVPLIVFGTNGLEYWVLGPSGKYNMALGVYIGNYQYGLGQILLI